MPNSAFIISVITFFYLLALAFYLAGWIFKKNLIFKLGTFTLIAAGAGNAAAFFLRWAETYSMGYAYVPLSNLYESLIFFSLCVAGIYLFVEFRYKVRPIGIFASLCALLSVAYASIGAESEIEPLIPALQSNWLIAHVITCFIGYAAFAIACGISIIYLLKTAGPKQNNGDGSESRIPDSETLDDLTHQMVTFGFLFLSIGIITGAVWAEQAWGRYWGWDPKETWSLVTWLIYATLLHARFMRGWTGKKIAVLSCIGFAAVLFTYFGVNLLPGLHSYL